MPDEPKPELWIVSEEQIAYRLISDVSRLNVETSLIRDRLQFLGPWDRPITDTDMANAISWLFRAMDERVQRHEIETGA